MNNTACISIFCYDIQISINNYFQYCPKVPYHERLGIHLAALGHTKIEPLTQYPTGKHPIGRAFSWERGRVLQALQIIAIREGSGEVEWMREQRPVKKGSVFVIKPGEWHRYRPQPESGWVEDWIELRGHLPDFWLKQNLFSSRFMQLELPSTLFSIFDALHKMVNTSEYTPVGLPESKALAIVSMLTSIRTEHGSAPTRSGDREMIAQARIHLGDGVEIHQTARLLGVSYSTLYRSFKRCTGLTPKQFAESTRLARAEAWLSDDQYSVKEIAAELGYHSASHFSLAFKRCYGVAPAVWKSKLHQA